MKKRLTFFLVVIILSNHLRGQAFSDAYLQIKSDIHALESYDSLSFFTLIDAAKKVSKNTNSIFEKADIYQMIGTYYYIQDMHEKALVYYDSALAVIEHNRENKLFNTITTKKITIAFEGEPSKENERLYLVLLEKLKDEKDTLNIISALNIYGDYLYYKMNFDGAHTSYNQALEYAIAYPDKFYEISTRDRIAVMTLKLGFYNIAEEQNHMILYLLKNKNIPYLKHNIHNNLALQYMEADRHEDAFPFLKNNLDFYKNSQNVKPYAITLFNLGLCYFKKGDFAMASVSIKESFSLLKENNMNAEYVEYFSKLIVFLSKNGMHFKAVNLYERISNKNIFDILHNKTIFLYNLSNSYAQIGKYKEALHFFKLYNSESAKIIYEKIIEDLEIKYMVAEKEKKLAEQQYTIDILETKSKYNRLKLILIIVTASVVLIVLLFIVDTINKRRVKKQMESFTGKLILSIDKERERISRDLHDEIGLRICMIRSLVGQPEINYSQSGLEPDALLVDLLDRIREISKNLHPSAIQISGLKPALIYMIQSIAPQKSIVFNHDIEDAIEELNLDTKLQILRIFQEALGNTIKHSDAYIIDLIAKKQASFFLFEYSDNGIGMNSDFEDVDKGMGIKNMKERARLINAQILFFNKKNNGLKIVLKLNEKS